MLSIIHAAEVQFRHEAAERDRERMLITAIRERAAALVGPTPAARARRTPLRAPRAAVAPTAVCCPTPA